MNFHERMMKKALSLAYEGRGKVSPNPMVGALLVKRGLVVARGYHKRFGGPHAEIVALKKSGFDARGTTLYVNLEPCSHYGKTPPCTKAIIESGIKEVFVGMVDPNPLVKGKGIKALREAGILVTVGVLEDECRSFNEDYVKFVTKGVPFVILKAAVSLDGKIALKSGESKWITSKEARSYAHDLRTVCDAVLVGANTVVRDDPSLSVRIARKFIKHPLRVVVDSSLKTSLRSKVYNKSLGGKTTVFTTQKAKEKRIEDFKKNGVDVIVTKGKGGHVPLSRVLKELGKKNVMSLLVEGGGEILTGFFKAGLADKLYLFIGNKIMGGKGSVSLFDKVKVSKLNQAFTLRDLSAIKLAEDLILSGYLK